MDTVATAPSLSRYYEAECAEVGTNWVTHPDPLAGSGAYVVAAEGFQAKKTAPPDAPEHYVRFRIDIRKDSIYHLLGRINAPSRSEDSYWYRLDGGNWRSWYQNLTTNGEWAWREVPRSPISLTAGQHTLDIAYRERNTQLDRLYVSPSDTLPQGLGGPDPACGHTISTMATAEPFASRPAISLATVAWSLYPNPAGEFITVVLPDSEVGAESLIVTDVNGRRVREVMATALTGQQRIRIDLGTLPAGLYRVRLKTAQSDSSLTFVRVY